MIDKDLDATYYKINTIEKLNHHRTSDNYPSSCQICHEKFELHDKVYRYLTLQGKYYHKGICKSCLKQNRIAEKL